jgi:hypothetical protein
MKNPNGERKIMLSIGETEYESLLEEGVWRKKAFSKLVLEKIKIGIVITEMSEIIEGEMNIFYFSKSKLNFWVENAKGKVLKVIEL